MKFSEIKLNLNEFVPYLPVMTGHTQTLLGHLVPSVRSSFKFEYQVLTLPDGDELLLEYLDNKSRYTISLYHGLAGSSESDYIRRSTVLAQRMGWNIIRVNHRGVKKTKAIKSYHSGRGEDASAVIEWARKKFVGTIQVALGFSMSGSILLNLLTERYGEVQPDVAIVVNAPLNLAKSSDLLTAGMSRVYDLRFYLLLKKMIREQGEVDIRMPLVQTTKYIDELYTSKVNGFKNAMDYYVQCSVHDYVDRIKTKTFVLTAQDDPFIDVQDYLTAPWNENVNLFIQGSGGHMGYFSKIKDPKYGRRWLDHYLESVFAKIESF